MYSYRITKVPQTFNLLSLHVKTTAVNRKYGLTKHTCKHGLLEKACFVSDLSFTV